MITPVLEKDHSGGKEGTDGEGTTLEAGKALCLWSGLFWGSWDGRIGVEDPGRTVVLGHPEMERG